MQPLWVLGDVNTGHSADLSVIGEKIWKNFERAQSLGYKLAGEEKEVSYRKK